MDDREALRRFAGALSDQFGDDAIVVVERQIAEAREEPKIAEVWRRVAMLLRADVKSRPTAD